MPRCGVSKGSIFAYLELLRFFMARQGVTRCKDYIPRFRGATPDWACCYCAQRSVSPQLPMAFSISRVRPFLLPANGYLVWC